ncbi:MAG: hypothetical protein HDQ88_06820, partial [Clostridia bacterium]|nr:hypothetical protein [Clostridia bacterium]
YFFLHYLVFYYMEMTQKNLFDYYSKDTYSSPPPKKRKRIPRTPTNLFDDVDTDSNYEHPQLTGLDDDANDYGTVNFNRTRQTSDKRAGKTWDNMKVNFSPDNYNFTTIPKKETTISTRELSRFTKNLADMLINGNLRIKFSPKCATRAGAKQYCQSKLDDRGYPRFKLIGTNAEDPFGNPICDMNGDQVDDIIICDKQGNPVIVNGYKLVQASPFKKIWMNAKASGKTNDSFEAWLAQQFNTTKDWTQINETDWQNGKIPWDLSKATAGAQSAYNTYNELGLGKPRLNTRLSARALWSSLYSEFIWNGAKYSFQVLNPTIAQLINCVNYLKLANALFIIQVEIPLAQEAGKTNWIEWVNHKQSSPKLVKKQLGTRVQQLYLTLQGESEKYNNNDTTAGETTDNLIRLTTTVIKAAFNVEANQTQLASICESIVNGNAPVSQINELKELFKTGIDRVVNNRFPGYLSYVKQQNERKPKAVAGFDDYMEMKWNE